MKEEKKQTSKIDFNKIKNGIVLGIKKVFTVIIKFIKRLSKIKIGKYLNGMHVLVGCVVLVVLFCFIFGGTDDVPYPVIYNNSDGDLYLIDSSTKNEEDAIKLGNGENTSNIKYANTTDRYVLFQKNEALYLYDSKEKGETTKIVSDIKTAEYYFTEDDKYIVALDEKDNLVVYDYKETNKIEKDVSEIVGMTDNRIMFIKENVLYVRSIKPSKDDRLKVTEEYDTYIDFSEDGKNIVYIDNERNLHLYDIKNDEDEKIAKNVSSYYCDSKSCKKMFYVENDNTKTIYYYNGKEAKSLSKDIYSVNAYDVDKKQIVFTKVNEKEYSLYYQKVDEDAVEIENGITSLRTVKLFEGKDIYYITSDNELKYAQINGAKINGVKSIGEDVNGYLIPHKKGYVYVGDVEDSKGTLYLVDNGKNKQIDENVANSLITVGNDGKSIYYLKDYKTTGDLYVSNGGRKGKEIDKDVYNYEYVQDDLIYLIKDYSVSKSRGDLYRYTNKSVLIAEGITRMADTSAGYKVD